MFEAIADTLRHPLLERERRRWSRRLSAWPKAALGLIGFVAALHGASLAARAAGWTTSPLPPAALDAAARAMIAGALATAMLAPVAVASWQLTPWLRSAEFEELLGTTASRSGIARALWALAWARCAAWTAGVQILSASFAFVAFDSAAAWNLAAKEAMRAAALLPALGVSASMAVHLGLERRNAGAVLWRALVWQAILFPLVGLLLAAVFVMGLLVIVAPLIAVVAHILSIFAGARIDVDPGGADPRPGRCVRRDGGRRDRVLQPGEGGGVVRAARLARFELPLGARRGGGRRPGRVDRASGRGEGPRGRGARGDADAVGGSVPRSASLIRRWTRFDRPAGGRARLRRPGAKSGGPSPMAKAKRVGRTKEKAGRAGGSPGLEAEGTRSRAVETLGARSGYSRPMALISTGRSFEFVLN
jgi:hypothetical protein